MEQPGRRSCMVGLKRGKLANSLLPNLRRTSTTTLPRRNQDRAAGRSELPAPHRHHLAANVADDPAKSRPQELELARDNFCLSL
jgi:hypothetical protein